MKKILLWLITIVLLLTGCSEISEDTIAIYETPKTNKDIDTTYETEKAKEDTNEALEAEQNEPEETDDDPFDNDGYTLTTVSSCDLSGSRKPNAKVDIGFDSDYANREYWAYTNEYSQLVYVEADNIILQNDDEENSGDDRYCNDEAKVPGVEESDLDEGHVIADSLGGVSNSYNITPQGSNLNRYGTQSDIEQDIRNNGGASNFKAEIVYENSTTQIPSSYTISYEINGQTKTEAFDNVYTPDSSINEVSTPDTPTTSPSSSTDNVYYANCTEVREAGADPIYTNDPGYSSKLDRDGDGVACE